MLTASLTRQELCAQLRISESTVRRLELDGLPCIEIEWMRRKMYSLIEVRRWMRRTNPEKAIGLINPLPRNYYGANARARAMNRLPAWADRTAIKAIYEEARRRTLETGIEHHVDHVIPMNGHFVSGLHVPANLQVLLGTENGQKHNYFEVGE